MKHLILCINSGSSSMKFALYGLGDSEELVAEGAVERIGAAGGMALAKGWARQAVGRQAR